MTTRTPANGARIRGALALELTHGSPVAHLHASQADAGVLGGLVARDLAGFAPGVASLELSLVAAHYDPVELLRPGWPVHEELDQLSARAPGEGARVIAFGAHDDRLPGTLAPSTEFAGGPLRLLPFVLAGDADLLAEASEVLERDLVERGMAGASTALAAQDLFGLQVEHARYLTLHDLCAMTALQYEHVGLEPLWPILETALFSPSREAIVQGPPEPPVRLVDGEARIALLSPDAWQAWSGLDDTPERLAARFASFEARQRQLAAVLQAHGIPVVFAHCAAGDDPAEALAEG